MVDVDTLMDEFDRWMKMIKKLVYKEYIKMTNHIEIDHITKRLWSGTGSI